MYLRIPADANPGMWNVRVRNADNQSGTKTGAFVVRAPPTVRTVVPASGIRGTTVDITNVSGTGFIPGAKVYLARTGNRTISATNVSVASPERITCTVTIPTSAGIGPWNITVKNPDGKSGMKTDAFMVKTVLPPTVMDITPSFGIRGTTIQISHLAGTRFALTPKPTVQLVKNTRVINATNVTVVNPNRITCTFALSPYTMTGPWDVKVINADMQYGVNNSAFDVIT